MKLCYYFLMVKILKFLLNYINIFNKYFFFFSNLNRLPPVHLLQAKRVFHSWFSMENQAASSSSPLVIEFPLYVFFFLGNQTLVKVFCTAFMLGAPTSRRRRGIHIRSWVRLGWCSNLVRSLVFVVVWSGSHTNPWYSLQQVSFYLFL